MELFRQELNFKICLVWGGVQGVAAAGDDTDVVTCQVPLVFGFAEILVLLFH